MLHLTLVKMAQLAGLPNSLLWELVQFTKLLLLAIIRYTQPVNLLPSKLFIGLTQFQHPILAVLQISPNLELTVLTKQATPVDLRSALFALFQNALFLFPNSI